MNVDELLKFGAVYLGGIITTVAVFRQKFTSIDARFDTEKALLRQEREAEKERRAMERAHDKEMLDVSLRSMRRSIRRNTQTIERIEARQRVNMELTADIARKLGVHHRALGDMPVTLSGENSDDE